MLPMSDLLISVNSAESRGVASTLIIDGERCRNRTYNLLIKSQAGLCYLFSGNSQLTNNLQESCAHREPLTNA
jgi:hypothetical protein